jgi:DNA replication ATP-dependent helicase Dna2
VSDLREVVMGKKIILSTVATFNSRKAYLKDLITFDMVIVDEASQLLEPDLAGILIRYQKFVLIGDQNQLPAVVTQSDSFSMVENQEMQDAGLVDLRTSLFERLYRRCESEGWQGAIGMLTDHFRMHEDIASLVNYCYNNKLEAKLARQIAPWVAYYEGKNHKLYPLLSQKRVLFLETLTEAKRKINNSEAEMAVELVRFIKSYGKNEIREPYSIGIITPFRAQIALIMHQLHEKGLNDDVMVDTVERYQGQQRDIIILSMAANDLQSFQGLQSVNLTGEIDRKLVVSLSRAKEQLIILGNSEILGNAKPYELLLNQLKGCGNFIPKMEVQSWFPEIQSSKVANEQFLN